MKTLPVSMVALTIFSILCISGCKKDDDGISLQSFRVKDIVQQTAADEFDSVHMVYEGERITVMQLFTLSSNRTVKKEEKLEISYPDIHTTVQNHYIQNSSGDWDLDGERKKVHESDGNFEYIRTYHKSGDNWHPERLFKRMLSGSEVKETTIYSYTGSGDTVPEINQQYTWQGNRITEVLVFSFSNNRWGLLQKKYCEPAVGQVQALVYQVYDPEEQVWEYFEKTGFTYTDNKISRKEYFLFSDTSWLKLGASVNYSYDANGNLTGMESIYNTYSYISSIYYEKGKGNYAELSDDEFSDLEEQFEPVISSTNRIIKRQPFTIQRLRFSWMH